MDIFYSIMGFFIKGGAFMVPILVVGADILARNILSPAEMPIGIVTALVGAPFFILLLLKKNV